MLKYLFLLFLTVSLNDPGGQVDEMTMKAIYIERFTRFIEWPEKHDDEFFRIQVIGNKRLAKKFRSIFKKMEIKKKSVLIHENDDDYNANFSPHLVYIADKRKLPEILDQIKQNSVLIVSEGAGGAQKGAMINLYRKQNKLKFEINELSIQNSALYVSYRLKKAAEHIINPVTEHQ